MGFKTLHLTNAWHETSGGIATFYRALMEAANRRGHSIRLIVPGERNRVEDRGGFARIYYLKAPPARFNSEYRMIYPSQYLGARTALRDILAAERPDLVEICDKYALNYLAALLREGLLPELTFKPVVVGLSCERMDDNFRTYIGLLPFSKAFCSAYLKWIYFPFFDHHIANSNYTAGELADASGGHVLPRGIWVRPMGVDLEHFSPSRKTPEARAKLLNELKAGDQSVVLVYAGRLAPEKHLPILFEAFDRLVRGGRHDYRLVVAGDGIERQRWEGFCESRAPGSAVFLGHIKGPEALADLLANADVFVHPNPHEPFGIAPLEAMASGLPLVAPDRGGVVTYANAENAWIAAPSGEGFAAAVEELLADPAEAARRAGNALRRAAEFSWEKAATAYLDLYAELHRAAAHGVELTDRPAFCSTPTSGANLAVSRRLEFMAKSIFRLASMPEFRPNRQFSPRFQLDKE